MSHVQGLCDVNVGIFYIIIYIIITVKSRFFESEMLQGNQGDVNICLHTPTVSGNRCFSTTHDSVIEPTYRYKNPNIMAGKWKY